MKTRNFLLFITFFSISYLQAQWANISGSLATSNQSIGAISPISADVVWGISWDFDGYTTPQYLVKTTDGGESWTVRPFAIPSELYAIQLFAIDERFAWLATADELNPISGKIFKTNDGGATWSEQSTSFTGLNETPAAVHFWNTHEGVAFGATCHDDFNDQIAIYITDDGGQNWTKVSEDAMPAQLPGEGVCIADWNGFYEVMGDIVWFLSSKGRVFKSTDRGRSWQAYEFGGERIASLAFKDELNGLAVKIFPNGAFRTVDGGETWSPIEISSPTHTSGIDYIPGTAGTYLVHNSYAPVHNPAMLVTYDDGESWENFTSNVELECFKFISPTVGFGGGNEGTVYRWEGFSLTGNREAVAKAPLRLFPNPANTELKVELPVNTPEAFNIQLMNLQGKLAAQQRMRNGEWLAVEQLPQGLYLMKATVEGVVYTGKFVKQ